MKPFDPDEEEGTEEDGNGGDEAAAERAAERRQGEREEDWFSEYMKPFNPDEEEGTQEQGGEREEAAQEQEGEPEEARKAKGTKVPIKPSKEEVDEHMLTHLPFRSWCPHCIRGKSKGRPHKKAGEEQKEVPTIALDYTFMHESQNKHEEKGMPILVIKDIKQDDTGTGMIFAQVVPQKGVQPFAVKTLAGVVAQLGHQELILRSDGEPAIVGTQRGREK